MAGNAAGRTFEFYYDISCPFAYIASTRIETVAARTGAHLVWRPVLLGAIYRLTEAPQGAAGSASDVFNPTKKAVTSKAFQRTLHRYNIPYNEPPKHPNKTTGALRLLYSIDESQRAQLSKALYRAYWVEGQDVSSNDVLIDVVRRSQILGAEVAIEAIKDGTFEREAQRKELETATGLAVERGSPGVPAFWVPNEVWSDKDGKTKHGRLYWGQDRLHFVESVLLALNTGNTGSQLSAIFQPLQDLIPRCAHGKGIASNEEVKVQFWYDFSSPWAFLGWTQLARLQRKFSWQLTIEMKPFLLGILFREIGAPNMPIASYSKQKRQYSEEDHRDWVKWLNAINAQEGKPDKPIDFKWSSNFPIRTPTALRAALVEPELDEPIFRACWEKDLNISDDSVLKSVISEAGYDADQIFEQANSKNVKAELRARTMEAKQAGLCGVPSYRVFSRKLGAGGLGKRDIKGGGEWKLCGDVVWGQDELAVVEDLVAGWREGDGRVAGVQNEQSSLSKL